MADETIERLRRHPALAQLRRVLRQEVLDQQRDVAAPLAERRQGDGHDVEPVEEVLAEAALAHHRLEIAVGGGEHPHIDAEGLLAAHALDRALLERAQQLRLQLRRHVADLVEEEGAAVGQLELAELALLGVGEGAPLVTEELGFEQRPRNGRRRHRDERPPRAPAVMVDRARDQLLAGARLAAQQHGHVAGRDAPDRLVDLLHASGAPPPG